MENLFGDFDFDLLKSPDFKEDSVREGKYPDVDDIYLEIMPLLQNGKTPEKQTIY